MNPKVAAALVRLERAVNMLADDVWNHVHAPDGEMVLRSIHETEYVSLEGLWEEDDVSGAIGGMDPD